MLSASDGISAAREEHTSASITDLDEIREHGVGVDNLKILTKDPTKDP